MRILITGAFGQLGHALQSVLSKKVIMSLYAQVGR
ncbi:MAG: hypothetical protein CM15mP44_5860 [Candidatus Neomarinimicrobiota bacterium]|nr:MAG: hypothetical protein CM15mP44_5860 [Candidatus Neomarinimicrobiota bacterium]